METKIYSPINVADRKALDIRVGDTVNVYQRIMDKGKVRLQSFNGIIIAHKHGKEAGATFTVRRVKKGSAIEKIFPLYSPIIDKIEIISRARTRRSKLYFFRNITTRNMRKKLSKTFSMDISTESFEKQKRQMQEEQKANEKAEQEEKIKVQEKEKAEEEKIKAKERETAEQEVKKQETTAETAEQEEKNEDIDQTSTKKPLSEQNKKENTVQKE